MNRYLINLSYIGTHFRGIQKNVTKGIEAQLDDPHSVEGALEIALRKFRPVNEFKIKISSRTDAGVHALHNTVHVDLERRSGAPYDPDKLTLGLNRSMGAQSLPVRILSTRLVPPTFHVRLCAKSRTYIYRLGILRPHFCTDDLQMHPFVRFLPIDEHDRCHFIASKQFDIDILKRVASMCQGYHDFRTFMATARGNQRQSIPTYTLRTIQHISVDPGTPMTTTFNRDVANKYYDYWDIRIKARSFLYNQVRRMVGTWIAAAEGRITERDVYQMLTIPAKHSWCDQAVVAPAHGLYLCQVEYDPADLEFRNELPGTVTEKQEIVAVH